MQTLIELYDKRPLENVLAVEVFAPERVVYICPRDAASDRQMQKKLRSYFRHRGLKTQLIFTGVSMFDTAKISETLRTVINRYPDCTVDITGGTDAALFAAGETVSGTEIPVITYSRKANSFYSIKNAPFAHEKKCSVSYKVEDCFMMAGGSMRKGRVDNRVLGRYMDDFDPFFALYLRFRRDWTRTVTYIQRLSQRPEGKGGLDASGAYTVKGERSSRISAPEDALRAMEGIGFIRDLMIDAEKGVSFTFRDEQIRTWLRDVGSVLEVYVYKACVDTGLFNDVITSAVVDWDSDKGTASVTNELDVMATRGIIPLFISCKTCEVKTEALNELAILRDRFGGEMAKAAIVTCERGNARMRSRAQELGIAVIDLDDLTEGRIVDRLKSIMK